MILCNLQKEFIYGGAEDLKTSLFMNNFAQSFQGHSISPAAPVNRLMIPTYYNEQIIYRVKVFLIEINIVCKEFIAGLFNKMFKFSTV